MRAAQQAIDYAEKRKQAIDRATHLREQRTLGVADEECTFAPARCVEKWVHCPAVGVGGPDFITALLGTQAARGWWRTRHPCLTHTVLIIRTAVAPVHHTMPARGGYTVPARSYTVPANLSFNQPQPRPRLFLPSPQLPPESANPRATTSATRASTTSTARMPSTASTPTPKPRAVSPALQTVANDAWMLTNAVRVTAAA